MRSFPALNIGRWRLHPARDELELDGQCVKLERRLTRLLLVLADARGGLIDHPTLMARVWAPLVVTPSSIYEAIARLRAVLARDATTPEYIASVPRRGYRLVAAVSGAPEDAWPRMAVLPWQGDGLPAPLAPLRERLADGLVAELSRIAPCRVLARATSAADDFDARALGVRFLVAGSLRVEGASLVVRVDLVGLPDGDLLANETVRLAVADGPLLASPVIERIARQLQLRLPRAIGEGGQAGFAPARQQAALAWRELYCRPQSAVSNAAAWVATEAALALDADDALAHACKAYAAWRGGNFGWISDSRETLFDLAFHHSELALAAEPELADAHFVRALVTFSRGEFPAADQGMRDAIGCAPSNAPAIGLLARMRCVLGHPEETAPLVQHALAISPLEPLRAVWHWIETLSWLALQRYDQALDSAQRAMLNPHNPHAWFCAIASAKAAGEAVLAERWLAEFRQRHPQVASMSGLARISVPDSGPVHTRQMQQYRELLSEAGLR